MHPEKKKNRGHWGAAQSRECLPCVLWSNIRQATYFCTVLAARSSSHSRTDHLRWSQKHSETGCRLGQGVLMLFCSLLCKYGEHLERGVNPS